MKQRICLACRKVDLANTRIRIARLDGQFLVDHAGNQNGRGAYVCYPCIPTVIKKKALNRSFRTNVPQEIYDELGNIN